MSVEDLLTPTLLVDKSLLERNIRQMQAACSASGVALWPHIKTHKTVEIARLQLEAGAAGLTCAKIGEAEALLPSGVRRVFIAYPQVDPRNAPRLRALSEKLDQLILAVTGEAQAEALESVLAAADLRLPVIMAVNTGLGREGVRSIDDAVRLAARVERLPHLELYGLFTHEGHSYNAPDPAKVAEEAHAYLIEARDRIGGELPLWPGATPTAAHSASLPGVAAVRPGTYVFGDLWQTEYTGGLTREGLALTILSTVVDRPEPGLALLDAGSKTLSSDRLPDGRHAVVRDKDGRAIQISRCSEEHGWATGADVDALRVGERVRLAPAHVCPTVNLTDTLTVIDGDNVIDVWRVAARGKVQ